MFQTLQYILWLIDATHKYMFKVCTKLMDTFGGYIVCIRHCEDSHRSILHVIRNHKKNLKRDVRATCILIKIEFFLWQLRNFDPRNRLNTVWFYLINVCFSSILKNWEHLLRFLFLLLWSTKKTIRTIDGRVIGLLLAFQIFKLTPMMPNNSVLTNYNIWNWDSTIDNLIQCRINAKKYMQFRLNILYINSIKCSELLLQNHVISVQLNLYILW